MKVRIKEKPREPELDGVRLDGYVTGMVRDVSSLMGTWLIMSGYAEPEMRHEVELISGQSEGNSGTISRGGSSTDNFERSRAKCARFFD